MIADHAAQGAGWRHVIDALCDPPESFQLYGIVAHVLTYSAHRQGTGPHDARPPRGTAPARATHSTG